MSSIGDEEPPDRGGTPSPLTWNPTQIPDSAARAVAKPGNKRPASIQLENADMSHSQSSLGSPSQRPHSYTKTITMERRPRPPPGKSYDAQAHRAITFTPQSSLPNGCALLHQDNSMPNDNLADLITKMLINLLSKFSDIIPNRSSKLHLPKSRKKH
ncbi:hypothetical protein MSG28_006426 [Choristoneura fumiferana]|uniref:Uncharacterized protein n=1 Tax=Choristoneura fumiferana TaxID=7141 RepID=A0ACC0JF32_CHOFU|nr:hypothetical protein MSG28_006426 [Choristoneura fumiferana]